MAKTIEDLIVKLKAEGFEHIDKLRGSFRELNKVTNATEAQLERTRKEIIDFGKESTNSIAVIQGQITALKGLQRQADINGTVFKNLRADVKAYEAQLKSAEAQLDSFNTKVQSAASVQSRFEKLGVPGLENQLSKRRDLLAQQTPLTNEYVTSLGGVIKVETALTRLYERQAVIAASARSVKFTPARGGTQDFDIEGLIRYAGVFQTLPNTNAAYAQALKELRQDLANLDRGTNDYLNTLLRLTYIQREASRVTQGFAQALVHDLDTGRAARSTQNLDEAIGALRAEMAQLDTATSAGSAAYARNANAVSRLQKQLDAIAQSYKNVTSSAAQATNAQSSYANTAIVANYFNRPAVRAAEQVRAAQSVPMPPREISGLYNQIGQIGMQPILNSIEMMGESYESVANDIRKATAASNGSTNSLQAQRAAWEALRNTLGDNKLALREIDKELNNVDRQLAKRGRGGGRLSGMQLAQGVGAALSGGIFGGPEGLIGGLGGLAVGGVGGAFAGAAFGAQVGMFRQQLGVVTDYSARIDKLQIALRGIVGSQDAYKQALAAAASVTRDLNIPQESAIQGMTRLSAAVKGAGGTVTDSAFAFRAINEAVKATGGNAEQADGALLALTQVFSKGKVSAEELNQIAERLPGTFTLFAKAAGMTGPQLQKALQEGQVGLNDLMKFLQLISSQYGQTALKIAASSQDAGVRLSVAMKQMQLDVGRALQPIGAQLQDAFAKFITSTTPAIIIAAKLTSAAIGGIYTVISSGLKLLVSMRGLLDNLSKAMLVFGGVTAGVFVASNITTFTSALKGVLGVLRTMLSIEKALLVVENARIAAQTILAGLTAGATKGKILGAVLGGAAGVGAVIGIGKLVEGVVKDIESGLANTLKGDEFKVPALSKFALPSTSSAKEAKDAERERQAAAEEAIRQQTSINRLLQEQLRLNYEAGTIDADKLSKLDAEEYLLKQIVRLRLNEVNLTSKTQRERQLGVINVNTDFKRELARIKKERGDLLNELKDLGKDVKKEWSDLTGEFLQESPLEVGLRRFEEARVSFIEKRDTELKALRERVGLRPEGASARIALGNAKAAAAEISPAQATAIVSKQILQSDIEALQRDIRTLESGANTMGTLGEIMDKHRSYWRDLDAGQRQYIANLAEIKDSLRFMQDSRIGVGFREGAQAYVQSIGTMREATAQLAQTGIKGVEDAIFSLVTTGTANFRDFAASILKDTARMIIQQLILRSVMQIIGAIGGGGAASTVDPLSNFNAGVAQYAPLANAMGNAFASNGIVPFAMGGVVTRPTMFAFANGGVGRLGLMGEAGPEAIMPLRRLPSGKLGVGSTGGGAVTVNVSVDATGSQVQGDGGQGAALGRAVASAVQAELIKQRRPGGILAA